jgi:hypothetical protein
MPHYKDGTPAQVGDLVKGKPYNTPREIVGEVISVTPGSESCNCMVAFVEVLPDGSPIPLGPVSAYVAQASDGRKVVLIPKTDYGETKAFEKVL